MTASHHRHDLRVLVPRSTDNGLWNALAAKIHDSSAAGSRPAGPLGSGRPISAPVMAAAPTSTALTSTALTPTALTPTALTLPDVVISDVVVDMFGYRRARHADGPLTAA